jgi:uncharacterized damage-inducible protein DinB
VTTLLEHFHRQFAWHQWANRQALSSLAGVADPRPLAWMSHVIGADWLWLGRVEGGEEPSLVWPDLTAQECMVELDQLTPRWHFFLSSLSPDDMESRITYVNSKGEQWENNVADILQHVVAHGAYHRGQVAAAVRAAGATPAYTDYIHAVRQGLLS